MLHFRLFQRLQLLLIMILNRIVDWANRIEQVAILLSTFLRNDCRWLSIYEALLDKSIHILLHGILCEADRISYRTETRVTLIGFSILTKHQISVDGNFASAQV